MNRMDGSLVVRIIKEREVSLSIILVIFLSVILILTPSFFQFRDIASLLGDMGTLGIVALGETLVIICRGIDLSVGGIMGITAIITGTMLNNHSPYILVLLTTIGIGLFVGLVNGILVAYLRIPAIITTLGTMNILFGIMFLITQGNWVNNVSWATFGGSLWGIPAPVYYMILLFLIFQILLSKYPIGRYLYAVGDNPDTARLLGIRTRWYETMAYVVSGGLAAIAGLITICYLGFATPTTGSNINLQAIAAAVIGGANIFGGKGTPTGTLLGAIFISIITSALVFFHLPSLWNDAAEGALILIALMSDAMLVSKKMRGGVAA